MKAEQINEEVKVEIKELAHLWHIKERLKDKSALNKHIMRNVNHKTYLAVTRVLTSI